jgi:hypothetical protein
MARCTDEPIGAHLLFRRWRVAPDNGERSGRSRPFDAKDREAMGDEARIGFIVADGDVIEAVAFHSDLRR